MLKHTKVMDIVRVLNEADLGELGRLFYHIRRSKRSAALDIISAYLQIDISMATTITDPKAAKLLWTKHKLEIHHLMSGFLKPEASSVARIYKYTLTAVFLISTMGYLGGVTFFAIPESNMRFVDIIIGFLLSSLIGVIKSAFDTDVQLPPTTNPSQHPPKS